jgi:hypothetical protein
VTITTDGGTSNAVTFTYASAPSNPTRATITTGTTTRPGSTQ